MVDYTLIDIGLRTQRIFLLHASYPANDATKDMPLNSRLSPDVRNQMNQKARIAQAANGKPLPAIFKLTKLLRHVDTILPNNAKHFHNREWKLNTQSYIHIKFRLCLRCCCHSGRDIPLPISLPSPAPPASSSTLPNSLLLSSPILPSAALKFCEKASISLVNGTWSGSSLLFRAAAPPAYAAGNWPG